VDSDYISVEAEGTILQAPRFEKGASGLLVNLLNVLSAYQ